MDSFEDVMQKVEDNNAHCEYRRRFPGFLGEILVCPTFRCARKWVTDLLKFDTLHLTYNVLSTD